MKNEMYIILTLIPLLAGCGDKKEAARGAMPVPEISVASPVVKDITLTKEYPGYLSSEKTVDLVARVNGTLQTIAYAPGSRVRKGQVLFVIEPTIYQDNVEQAEAELNTSRANLEYAQNNYARMLEAVKSDAVSQIQVLQSKSNVATSQAAVSNAEAALNTARTNLGYCTVRAPFDGTVSRNQVDVGSYVGGEVLHPRHHQQDRPERAGLQRLLRGRRLRRGDRGRLRHSQLRLRREPPRRHPYVPHRQKRPGAIQRKALRRERPRSDRRQRDEPQDRGVSGRELHHADGHHPDPRH